MKINIINNSNQHFGALPHNTVQNIILDAKQSCKTENELNAVRDLVEDLYDVFPDTEVISHITPKSFFQRVFKKDRSLQEMIFLDDSYHDTIVHDYGKETVTPIMRLRTIVNELKKLAQEELNI